MILFGIQGPRWILRKNDVTKVAPKSWPGLTKEIHLGDRNRLWEAKKSSKQEQSTLMKEMIRNVTKKYRNWTLPNLKKYGFVYTKLMFLKKGIVGKKSHKWPPNHSKINPICSWGRLEGQKDASKKALKDKMWKTMRFGSVKQPQTCKSATSPRFPEHLSLHTSLSFSLQEADLNFNHAGSVLSVIRD